MSKQETKHPSLQAALVAASADVQSPDKDGRNDHHRYDYTTAEAMLDTVRRAMHPHGLTVRMGAVSYGEPVGDAWPVSIEFVLAWEGGVEQVSAWTFPAIPGRGRPLDKAVNAALTNATSYYLRGLLSVPRGLGPAVDDRDDRQYEPGKAPAPAELPPFVRARKAIASAGARDRTEADAIATWATEGQVRAVASLEHDEGAALRVVARLARVRKDGWSDDDLAAEVAAYMEKIQ